MTTWMNGPRMSVEEYRRSARATDDPELARVLNEQADVVLASTPDPDSAGCVECGGGLAHFPECSTYRTRTT